MPAKKPPSLIARAETKAARAERAAADASTTPKTLLQLKPPAALKGHAEAVSTWKELLHLYDETEGTIVTAFDQNLLIKYCLAQAELEELSKLRAEIKDLWTAHNKTLAKMKPRADNLKDYFGALAQANALLQRFQGMDARLDGKRKYLLSLEQSLYLTPRSRAGVSPTPKDDEEPPKDGMDQLLGY
jgi:hypothetical protein